ncbi:helix-turn-helix transcriptional regulator [Spongiactinospora sp. TRM90649]|uniref:helix-turn-helix domain-containing protein n=1 Tax=Spongiactinospora sp. TRM90649 TaxID=3031114 RepID=UPI0023F6ED33|nr:helix-turn-helix transcriptional regulator [Spongiactinospora sp. TRM90649]MDF5755664.1 helix-turn-helix transcriptional regulator [Spongiactinospora sp. TRM90649]
MAAFGEKVRELMRERGFSLRGVAKAINYDVGYLSKVLNGQKPPSVALAQRLDNVLGAKGAVAASVPPPASAEEVDATKRRDALRLGLAATVVPEVLHRVLGDSVAEAMEFTRLSGESVVGKGTLEHLESVVASLNAAYCYGDQTTAELFAITRAYRLKVAKLLQGAHTLAEGRELYVQASWLSELLAWAAHDLGASPAAEAWAVDAFEHGDQAGHDELCAWATDAMASIAFYGGRNDHAIAAARRGIAKTPARHPLQIRLRMQAARAHARVGEAGDFQALFAEAIAENDRLPSRPPGHLGTDTAPTVEFSLTSYPASAWTWLGDFEKARGYARAAVSAQESLPLGVNTAAREAIARAELGIALAELGTPDEAAALGQQALTCPRLIRSVRTKARDLDRVLTRRYPGLGVARDFHEAYANAVGSRNVTPDRT